MPLVEIGETRHSIASLEERAAETVTAMAAGAQVIYQAVFFDGTFLGRVADFSSASASRSASGRGLRSTRHEAGDEREALLHDPAVALQRTVGAGAGQRAGTHACRARRRAAEFVFSRRVRSLLPPAQGSVSRAQRQLLRPRHQARDGTFPVQSLRRLHLERCLRGRAHRGRSPIPSAMDAPRHDKGA